MKPILGQSRRFFGFFLVSVSLLAQSATARVLDSDNETLTEKLIEIGRAVSGQDVSALNQEHVEFGDLSSFLRSLDLIGEAFNPDNKRELLRRIHGLKIDGKAEFANVLFRMIGLPEKEAVQEFVSVNDRPQFLEIGMGTLERIVGHGLGNYHLAEGIGGLSGKTHLAKIRTDKTLYLSLIDTLKNLMEDGRFLPLPKTLERVHILAAYAQGKMLLQWIDEGAASQPRDADEFRLMRKFNPGFDSSRVRRGFTDLLFSYSVRSIENLVAPEMIQKHRVVAQTAGRVGPGKAEENFSGTRFSKMVEDLSKYDSFERAYFNSVVLLNMQETFESMRRSQSTFRPFPGQKKEDEMKSDLVGMIQSVCAKKDAMIDAIAGPNSEMVSALRLDWYSHEAAHICALSKIVSEDQNLMPSFFY